MRFYIEQHDDSVVLLPSISATLGRCECCDEVRGLRIGFSLFIWTVGLEFNYSNPCQ